MKTNKKDNKEKNECYMTVIFRINNKEASIRFTKEATDTMGDLVLHTFFKRIKKKLESENK